MAAKQKARPNFWIVRQGASSARVAAPDYLAAVARAGRIGFSRYDSIVLDEVPSKSRIDRALDRAEAKLADAKRIVDAAIARNAGDAA